MSYPLPVPVALPCCPVLPTRCPVQLPGLPGWLPPRVTQITLPSYPQLPSFPQLLLVALRLVTPVLSCPFPLRCPGRWLLAGLVCRLLHVRLRCYPSCSSVAVAPFPWLRVAVRLAPCGAHLPRSFCYLTPDCAPLRTRSRSFRILRTRSHFTAPDYLTCPGFEFGYPVPPCYPAVGYVPPQFVTAHGLVYPVDCCLTVYPVPVAQLRLQFRLQLPLRLVDVLYTQTLVALRLRLVFTFVLRTHVYGCCYSSVGWLRLQLRLRLLVVTFWLTLRSRVGCWLRLLRYVGYLYFWLFSSFTFVTHARTHVWLLPRLWLVVGSVAVTRSSYVGCTPLRFAAHLPQFTPCHPPSSQLQFQFVTFTLPCLCSQLPQLRAFPDPAFPSPALRCYLAVTPVPRPSSALPRCRV